MSEPASAPAPGDAHPGDHVAPRDAPEAPSGTADEHHEPGLLHGLKHKVTDKKDELMEKANPPGGYDDTPFPDVPPGWTVRFVFHKAENLPAADITTQAADPYIAATLTSPIPKRHKEDPPIIRRTKTIRNNVNPEWNEEWVVANVPSGGFKLKCRLYDEDYPDHDDRLGNVSFECSHIDAGWSLKEQWFDVKKRMGSKRAYLFKAITSTIEKSASMTGRLLLTMEVLGRSDGFGAQMYTIGPGIYFKHFSPMLGRLTGIKVNEDSDEDDKDEADEKNPQKFE